MKKAESLLRRAAIIATLYLAMSARAQVIDIQGVLTSSTLPLFSAGDRVEFSFTLLSETGGEVRPGIFVYTSSSTVLTVGDDTFSGTMPYLGLYNASYATNDMGMNGYGVNYSSLGSFSGFGVTQWGGVQLSLWSDTNIVTSIDGMLLPDLPRSDFNGSGGSLPSGALYALNYDEGPFVLGSAAFEITGYTVNGQASNWSAVPEPSTYAALVGLVSLVGAGFLRAHGKRRAILRQPLPFSRPLD